MLDASSVTDVLSLRRRSLKKTVAHGDDITHYPLSQRQKGGFMKSLVIRIPEELHDWLKRKAETECRSINAQLTYWIKQVRDDEDY